MTTATVFRFDPFNHQYGSKADWHAHVQEVVNYGESRLRRAVSSMLIADKTKQVWLQKYLRVEIFFFMSYVGIAASVGLYLDIPIILRSLANSFACIAIPDLPIDFAVDFVSALEAGTTKADSFFVVPHYRLPWWKATQNAQDHGPITEETLGTCLEYHRTQLAALRSAAPQHPFCPSAPTGHRMNSEDLLNAVSRTASMVDAFATAAEADRINSARRAAAFFMLHEASVVWDVEQDPGLQGPQGKWVTGNPLTIEDVRSLYIGHKTPLHDGYMYPQPTGVLAGHWSEEASWQSGPSSTLTLNASACDFPPVTSHQFPSQFDTAKFRVPAWQEHFSASEALAQKRESREKSQITELSPPELVGNVTKIPDVGADFGNLIDAARRIRSTLPSRNVCSDLPVRSPNLVAPGHVSPPEVLSPADLMTQPSLPHPDPKVVSPAALTARLSIRPPEPKAVMAVTPTTTWLSIRLPEPQDISPATLTARLSIRPPEPKVVRPADLTARLSLRLPKPQVFTPADLRARLAFPQNTEPKNSGMLAAPHPPQISTAALATPSVLPSAADLSAMFKPNERLLHSTAPMATTSTAPTAAHLRSKMNTQNEQPTGTTFTVPSAANLSAMLRPKRPTPLPGPGDLSARLNSSARNLQLPTHLADGTSDAGLNADVRGNVEDLGSSDEENEQGPATDDEGNTNNQDEGEDQRDPDADGESDYSSQSGSDVPDNMSYSSINLHPTVPDVSYALTLDMFDDFMEFDESEQFE